MQYLIDVFRFHQKFGIEQPSSPRLMDENLSAFRVKFLKEELSEYQEALSEGDLERQLDSLADLVYVALGTALISGFDFHAAWERIQRANMSKERAAPDGSNSTRGSAFDVVKPEGWVGPDHSDLVQLHHVRHYPELYIAREDSAHETLGIPRIRKLTLEEPGVADVI